MFFLVSELLTPGHRKKSILSRDKRGNVKPLQVHEVKRLSFSEAKLKRNSRTKDIKEYRDRNSKIFIHQSKHTLQNMRSEIHTLMHACMPGVLLPDKNWFQGNI